MWMQQVNNHPGHHIDTGCQCELWFVWTQTHEAHRLRQWCGIDGGFIYGLLSMHHWQLSKHQQIFFTGLARCSQSHSPIHLNNNSLLRRLCHILCGYWYMHWGTCSHDLKLVCFDADLEISEAGSVSVFVCAAGGFNLRDSLVFSLAAAKSFHLLCCKWPELHCVTGLKDGDMSTLSERNGLCVKSHISCSEKFPQLNINKLFLYDSYFLNIRLSYCFYGSRSKCFDSHTNPVPLPSSVSQQLRCDTCPLVFLEAPPTWHTSYCAAEASLPPSFMWASKISPF